MIQADEMACCPVCRSPEFHLFHSGGPRGIGTTYKCSANHIFSHPGKIKASEIEEKPVPSLEDVLCDVLFAFVGDPNAGRDTLERCLREYPEYADELIHASHKLSRIEREDEAPLSSEQQEAIDRAWQRHIEGVK